MPWGRSRRGFPPKTIHLVVGKLFTPVFELIANLALRAITNKLDLALIPTGTNLNSPVSVSGITRQCPIYLRSRCAARHFLPAVRSAVFLFGVEASCSLNAGDTHVQVVLVVRHAGSLGDGIAWGLAGSGDRAIRRRTESILRVAKISFLEAVVHRILGIFIDTLQVRFPITFGLKLFDFVGLARGHSTGILDIFDRLAILATGAVLAPTGRTRGVTLSPILNALFVPGLALLPVILAGLDDSAHNARNRHQVPIHCLDHVILAKSDTIIPLFAVPRGKQEGTVLALHIVNCRVELALGFQAGGFPLALRPLNVFKQAVIAHNSSLNPAK